MTSLYGLEALDIVPDAVMTVVQDTLQQNAKKMAVLIPSNDISAVATCYHFGGDPLVL